MGTAALILDIPVFTVAMEGSNEYPPTAHYPLGKRELTADFNKGVLASNLSTTKRPDALTFDYLRAFSLGPKAIGDLSGGIINRPWYVRADNDEKVVYVARANDTNTAWDDEVSLFSFTGEILNEIDFAFEQNGRHVVCAERTISGTKEVWLYWYDPSVPGFVFVKFDDGRTPRVVLDNPLDITNSDVQFFYLKPDTGLVVRTQRDTYDIAVVTTHVEETDWYLEDVFYTNNWRIAAILVQHTEAGLYNKKRMETTLMSVFLGAEDNKIKADVAVVSIMDKEVLLRRASSIDLFKTGVDITSIDIHDLFIYATLYDIDKFLSALSVSTISDKVVKTFHTLYGIDLFSMSMIISSMSDVEIILRHTLFDKDAFNAGISFTSIDNS